MKKNAVWTGFIAALVLSACAANNPSDPYEPYNRAMFKFNDKADRYVMQPVARGYRAAVPSPVRQGVTNVFDNLRDVVSFGSNVLRGNAKNATYDFMRVAVNTTFGLGGLINVADAAGMQNNKNTLGDTFASWGWKNSHYFVYPLSGPSTVRDSIGSTIVTVYSPQGALLSNNDAARYTVTALNAVNQREQMLDLTDSLNDAALDPYLYVRDAYMAARNHQIGNTTAAEEEEYRFEDETASEPAAEVASAVAVEPVQ